MSQILCIHGKQIRKQPSARAEHIYGVVLALPTLLGEAKENLQSEQKNSDEKRLKGYMRHSENPTDITLSLAVSNQLNPFT